MGMMDDSMETSKGSLPLPPDSWWLRVDMISCNVVVENDEEEEPSSQKIGTDCQLYVSNHLSSIISVRLNVK
jgi:hypothetical protein